MSDLTVCEPGTPAYIRGWACIQGPASISTTALDPWPVFEARLVFKARLVFEEIRYVLYYASIVNQATRACLFKHLLNTSKN